MPRCHLNEPVALLVEQNIAAIEECAGPSLASTFHLSCSLAPTRWNEQLSSCRREIADRFGRVKAGASRPRTTCGYGLDSAKSLRATATVRSTHCADRCNGRPKPYVAEHGVERGDHLTHHRHDDDLRLLS